MATPLCVLSSSKDGTRVAAAFSKHVCVFTTAPPAKSFAVEHAGHVRAVAFDALGERLATAGDDKTAFVWPLSGAPATATHRFPKRPTGVAFCGQRLLLSDKFGDVFAVAADASSSSQKDHECVLGHCSVITCLAASHDGALLATGDRDERVRVSHLPHAFDIASFCLSHTQFVAGAVFLAGSFLATGAADGTLRSWDAMTGRCISTVRPAGDSETAVVVPCAYDARNKVLAVRIEGAAKVFLYAVSESGELSQTAAAETHAPPMCLAFVAGCGLLAGFAVTPVATVISSPGEEATKIAALASAICAASPVCSEKESQDTWKAFLMEPMRKTGGPGDEEEGDEDEPDKKKPKKE